MLAKDLFQLQELDLQLESKDKAVKAMSAELGESQLLRDLRRRVAEADAAVRSLQKEQRSIEQETEDLSVKIGTAEQDLYGGRIRVPKELSNLQLEITGLKSRKAGLEDQALALMESLEAGRSALGVLREELKVAEITWNARQSDLMSRLEAERREIADIGARRLSFAKAIDPIAVATYDDIRRQKVTAVARVEQGICRGCRISLPTSQLQLVRSGALAQCGSCGRILYLP